MSGLPSAFGVAKPSQVRDAKVRRLAEEFGYLVKPRLDEEFSYHKYTTAKKIIDDSDCYVFFGVSFGESDTCLWNAIAQSLVANSRRKAYLSAYFDIHDAHDIPRDCSNRVQDSFWSYIEPFCSMSMMGDLDDQIFPTGVGPFVDPRGQSRFFDPLRLNWLKGVLTRSDMNLKPVCISEHCDFLWGLYALVIGLSCGRWTLVALDEVDYGLMGVVGGLTAFIGFFFWILSGAVGRFYAISLGKE